MPQIIRIGAAGGGGADLSDNNPVNVDTNAPSPGVGAEAARDDHKHDISTAAPSALVVGGSNVTGTSASTVHADHLHALPAFGTGSGTFAEGDDSRFGAAGGSANEIQYSNAGVLAGLSAARSDGGGALIVDRYSLDGVSALPSNPSSGNLVGFATQFAGRDLPWYGNADGPRFPLRSRTVSRRHICVRPNNESFTGAPTNTNGGLVHGCVLGVDGTVTHPAPTYPGTVQTSMRRSVITSATGTNNGASFFLVENASTFGGILCRGDATNVGGFDMETEFSIISNVTNGTRTSVGITQELAAQNSADLDNSLLFAYDTGDTDNYFRIRHKNGSSASTVITLDGTVSNPLGSTFAAAPRNVTTAVYRINIWCLPNGSFYGIRVYRVDTDELCYEGRLSSNIPANNVALYWINDRSTGTTSGTAVVQATYYIEGWSGMTY